MTDAVPEADAQEQRQPLLEREAWRQPPRSTSRCPRATPWTRPCRCPFDEDDAPR